MAVPDANISRFFSEAITQALPYGDMTIVGIVGVLVFMYLMWGFGIGLISTVMLGFILFGLLHFAFGGIFTIIFLLSGGVVGALIIARLYSGISRFG